VFRDVRRHLEGIVKEALPNFGPDLPKSPEENGRLQVSEILAAIVKGFERGYIKEKVLHCNP
jgi:hypothetical protein